MTLAEQYNEILKLPLKQYSHRFGGVISESEYYQYASNTGHTYYHLLMKLIRYYSPKAVLELGTSIGRSALHMMVELPNDSKLVTVDIGSFLRIDLLSFVDDRRLKIIFGDDLADDVVTNIVGYGPFDFMYIDSEHNYDQAINEWNVYSQHLVDGAIVVVDDISLNDGMIRFWNSLPYEKVDCGKSVHFSGFGLFRFTKEIVHG